MQRLGIKVSLWLRDSIFQTNKSDLGGNQSVERSCLLLCGASPA